MVYYLDMAEKDMYIPTQSDFDSATGQILEDIAASRIGAKSYFDRVARLQFPGRNHPVAQIANLLTPRDRTTGDAFEHGSHIRETALLGFAVGALYIAKVYPGRISASRAVRKLSDGINLQGVEQEESMRPGDIELDTDFAVSNEIIDIGLYRIGSSTGEKTQETIEQWSEEVTPIIAAQRYLGATAGALVDAAHMLQMDAAKKAYDQDILRMTTELTGVHDTDWDAGLAALLSPEE